MNRLLNRRVTLFGLHPSLFWVVLAILAALFATACGGFIIDNGSGGPLTTGAPHAVPFLTGQADARGNGHLTITAATFASDCGGCHAYSGTSPLAGAPLCSTCHTLADPTAPATNAGTCLSCHVGAAGLPLGPGGTSFPSLSGAHAKHLAIGTPLQCESCHGGSGPGTTSHYANAKARTHAPSGPAPVAIAPLFSAKTGGGPTFDAAARTCSGVSCHGGQPTPNWQTGTLSSSVQCTACHAVAASAGLATQYNDAFGRHSQVTHDATAASNGIHCTTCHDMGNGSSGALAHFRHLDTPAVDGVASGVPADELPSGTIAFDPAVVSGAATYAVTDATQGNGGCTLACHGHTHTPSLDTWTAKGAPHRVPFLSGQVDSQSNGHFTVSATAFAADCATCHAYSGTSPNPDAPLCGTCHTRGDPTAAGTGAGTCLSCHEGAAGLGLGPTGTSFPNLAGAHGKHLGLKTPLTCDTCHAGSGAGTATHSSNADRRVMTPTGPAPVSIASTYDAQSGGKAAFDKGGLTCTGVSCHGGKVAPSWTQGAIDSSRQCLLCHAINRGALPPQYNDAVGRHAWGTHATAGSADCTLCHDMAQTNTSPGAANHFKYLDTPAVSGDTASGPGDQLPSGTLRFKTTDAAYPITGSAAYTISATAPEGDGSCSLSCHGTSHVPAVNHWKAPNSVAHPVPFLTTDTSDGGHGHQSLTAAQFDAECTNCHDQSGTISNKTGPSCTECHIKGSPLATGACLSCHEGPSFTTQGPTGAAWPNLKGAHLKHLLLKTFTRATPALPGSLTASAYPQCEACHVGSVPGDAAQTHYANANRRVASPVMSGPAPVSVAQAFNAQTGAATTTVSATAFTCANVSCHGGQTTPGWQSGTLPVDAATSCAACHVAGATQYNAPVGRHTNPKEHLVTCDNCHDMTLATQGAQNHYKYLDTAAVSGAPTGMPSDQYPSETIHFGPAVTGSPTYSVTTQGQGGCALTCHRKSHTVTKNVWR